MLYLISAICIWSFSFSFTGAYLSGQVDPYFIATLRVFLAMLVFLPFLRIQALPKRLVLMLMGCGATQLGLMYLFYYHAFAKLSVPEVLIFMVFIPIYITLFYDLFEGRFNWKYLAAALFAVLGALVIRFNDITSDYIVGFLLLQCSNLCSALGQVGFKRFVETKMQVKIPQQQYFAWFYVGAFSVVFIAWQLFSGYKLPTYSTQWIALTWLGIVSSGIGYFLWNKGGTKVSSGTLAVMNNVLIPAGIFINLVFWNKETDLKRLTIGGLIILAALLFCHKQKNKNAYESLSEKTT